MKISGISYVNRNRRRHRHFRPSTFVSILLLLTILSVVMISARMSWRLIHPAKILPQLPNANEFSTLREVSFLDIQNQTTLKGWYFSAKDPENVIILAHRYGGNRLIFEEKTPQFIQAALARNFNVLSFDFRGAGLSQGNIHSLGFYEKDDLLGAIRYAKSVGGKNISLLGLSTGAADVLLAASVDPGLVTAVVADSSFSNLKSYLYTNLPVWNGLPTFPFSLLTVPLSSLFTGIDASEVNPQKAIGNIPAEKIMLIHSEDDQTVPYEESQKLFQEADSAAVYWVLKSAPHGQIFHTFPKEYIERVLSFVQKRTQLQIALETQQIKTTSQPVNPLRTPSPQILPTPIPSPSPSPSPVLSATPANALPNVPPVITAQPTALPTPANSQPNAPANNTLQQTLDSDTPAPSPVSTPQTAPATPEGSKMEGASSNPQATTESQNSMEPPSTQ